MMANIRIRHMGIDNLVAIGRSTYMGSLQIH